MEISQLNEEKKAIEMLRNYDNEDNLHKIHQSINVLLNLIEKQKKEIENLKELMAHKNGYTKQLEEDLFENASNYVVNKDKIRDLINKDAFEVNTKEYGNIEVIDINNIHELLKEK